MIWKPSRRLIVLLLSTLSVIGCEEDETALENTQFRINGSDEFIEKHPQSVVIISDYQGEVLVTLELDATGLHELQVPGRGDGVYHITVFDGKTSFQTFTFVAPDEFSIDVLKSQTGTPMGSHFLLLEDLSISAFVSGQNVEYFHGLSNENIELAFTQSSSDLYLFYEKNSEPRFLYYPSLSVNGSTTITATDFENGQTFSTRTATLTPNLGGPKITLSGSVEPDSRKMEYFLSRNNGGSQIFIPDMLMSKLKFFSTTFLAKGNTYTLVGPEIASRQKVLTVQGVTVKPNPPNSLFYSMETSGAVLKCLASAPTFSWIVLSPPGRNVTVRLPKLAQEFLDRYGLSDLQTLRFESAAIIKDTRFDSYQELVKASLKNEYPVLTTEYELYTQYIEMTN